MGQNRIQKAVWMIWELLSPIILYYCTFSAVYILSAYIVNVSMGVFGETYRTAVTGHAGEVQGLIKGLSMLLGILPVISLNREEFKGLFHGMSENTGLYQRFCQECMYAGRRRLVYCTAIAMTVSTGLNLLIGLSGIAGKSAAYQQVSARQYGLAIGVGILLYGLLAPFQEELLFRGCLYNRMKKYMKPRIAIILSGLMFGVYHGNMVQALYAFFMGVLIAYLYEISGSFLVPYVVHAVANVTVYLLGNTSLAELAFFQNKVVCGIAAVALLAVGVVLLLRLRVSRAMKQVLDKGNPSV